MRIWTIQDEAAWEYLNTHGVLQANTQHQSNDWPHAYGWMREQLIKRINQPSNENAALLWGWYQWCENSKRPDLRCVRHHWGYPGDYVMIECEIPNNDILVSDHDAWHITLNNGYLGLDQDDCDDFYERLRKLNWKRGEKVPPGLDWALVSPKLPAFPMPTGKYGLLLSHYHSCYSLLLNGGCVTNSKRLPMFALLKTSFLFALGLRPKNSIDYVITVFSF